MYTVRLSFCADAILVSLIGTHVVTHFVLIYRQILFNSLSIPFLLD